MRNNMEACEEVLRKEGYDSHNELLHEWALLLALSRSEQYSAECESFERRYGMKIEEFEKGLRQGKGREDFEREEDLDDWEFCLNAMKWWKDKVKELQGAAHA